MALLDGEQSSGGQILDLDGRLIVVGPGGVAIGGGGGGTGGTVDIVDRAGRVLGTVEVSNFPASQAVSDGGGSLTVDGTVTANAGTGPWPVTDNGGALSVDDAGGSLTVDGSVSVSNLPATQPVSGTVTANVGTGTQPVSGTVALDAASLTALETITVGTALPAGANNIGDVDVLSLPSLPAGTNQIGTTLGPALAKGAQGSSGYSTQDLKDAGRNLTTYANNFASGTATDALVSLTGYKGNAQVGATTTPAVVTTGKTLRVEAIYGSYFAIATMTAALVKLRANIAGTVAIGSPIVLQWIVGTTVAVAGAVTHWSVPIPDGLEFAAGTGIGVSVQGLSSAGAGAASGALGIQIAGYEY